MTVKIPVSSWFSFAQVNTWWMWTSWIALIIGAINDQIILTIEYELNPVLTLFYYPVCSMHKGLCIQSCLFVCVYIYVFLCVWLKNVCLHNYTSQMSLWKGQILLTHSLIMSPEIFTRCIESYRVCYIFPKFTFMQSFPRGPLQMSHWQCSAHTGYVFCGTLVWLYICNVTKCDIKVNM